MRKIVNSDDNTGLSFDKIGVRLKSLLGRKGGRLSNPDAAKVSWSLESLSNDALAESEASSKRVVDSLAEEVGEKQWNEELTDAQRDAGLIVAHAASDPTAYHAMATAEVTDSNYALDASSVQNQNIATESYDQRELEKMMPYSIAYNIGAARQDSAMEAVWPTIVLTADQAGLELEVTRTMVHYEFKHTSQGAATTPFFDQKSLIDALIDIRILRNHATDVVPLYNETVGVFDTVVGAQEVKVDNQKVTTGAILFNVPFNLISAGANSLTDPYGVKDMTDTIDQLVRLKSVWADITAADDTVSQVKFDTLDLLTTSFQKSQEGNERDMTLAWNTSTFPIDGTILDKTGQPAAAMASFRTAPNDKYVLHLKVSAHGRLNLADGNGELQAGSATIDRIYKSVEVKPGVTDLELVEDPTEVAAVKSLIKSIKLRSFNLDARYANLNRRERGLIVRTDTRVAKYTIQLQSPISALKPTVDTQSGYNIDAAVQATRVANTVAGIEELLRMDDLLSRYRSSGNRLNPASDIPGIGTWLIRPYYDYKVVDMTNLVNNTNSHTLLDDISNHLTLLIKDRFAKAMMISGWVAAQECSSNNSKEKPTAVIITDPRISQYLWVKGDTRLLGDSFNAVPVVSTYLNFRDKIYVVPRRESSVNSPDGLNFGNMFWLPELITNMPISRNGQISNEFTVQTRRRHICHCPIMIRIDLDNMDKVIDTKVATAVIL